jgi:hypothetical protein
MKLDRLRDAMHDFIALLGSRTAIVTSPSDRTKPSYRLIDIPMMTQLEIDGAPSNGE